MEKQNTIKQRWKERFAQVSKNRSLVDELIAQRREAAKQEVRGDTDKSTLRERQRDMKERPIR